MLDIKSVYLDRGLTLIEVLHNRVLRLRGTFPRLSDCSMVTAVSVTEPRALGRRGYAISDSVDNGAVALSTPVTRTVFGLCDKDHPTPCVMSGVYAGMYYYFVFKKSGGCNSGKGEV